MLDLTFRCSSLPAPFDPGQSSSGHTGWAIAQNGLYLLDLATRASWLDRTGPGVEHIVRTPGAQKPDPITSSVVTRKSTRVLGPKVRVSGTSAASRPRAIRILPIRGSLLLVSNMIQRPPR